MMIEPLNQKQLHALRAETHAAKEAKRLSEMFQIQGMTVSKAAGRDRVIYRKPGDDEGFFIADIRRIFRRKT